MMGAWWFICLTHRAVSQFLFGFHSTNNVQTLKGVVNGAEINQRGDIRVHDQGQLKW